MQVLPNTVVKMKIFAKFVYGLLLVCFVVQTSYAQTLHSLIVGATDDFKIGKGITRNLINMNKIIQDVVGVLDCEFEQEIFDHSKCTKANVTNWINNLDIDPEDVVFFFYSGHGGRALNDTDIFPQMCMNDPSNQALYLPVSHVEDMISKKKPRLAIIITECCNSENPGIKIKPLFAMSTDEYSSVKEYDAKALRDLFFNTKGIVKISSSKPKEYSWIYDSTDAYGGGMFVNNFIDSFNDAVIYKKLPANWSAIFNDTHDKVFAIDIHKDGKIYKQEPIAYIGDSKQKDKPIDIVKRDKTGTLFQALQYLVNDEINVDTRLSMMENVKQRHFTPNAKVATIASNGTTIVDYENIDTFLKRIILSPYIKQISILEGENEGKNSLIKVHELRK